MDQLTISLMNPTWELLYLGGIIGFILGFIVLIIGIIVVLLAKKKKIHNKWGWWVVGFGTIAIITGITTLLKYKLLVI